MSANIALLPYSKKLGTRPGRIALDQLDWPLGRPAGTEGQCLADLGPDDHLIIHPRDTMYTRPTFGTRARVSVMVLEPGAIHGHHIKLLRWAWRRFHRVLTCNEALLADIPNGVFFPAGGAWVPNWRTLDVTKSRMCSLIASAKRSQEGHILRHETIAWAASQGVTIDAIGGGYIPFGAKSDGLAPYRYSVVIENVRERNYFSEKLLDALLCKTVPIYWGCPNVGDFFDTSGLILCESAEDIHKAMQNMSEADYAARVPDIETLREKAAYFGETNERAARAVLESSPS
ncbi:hypothetical protein PEL8287_03628 [Roseovarius litorisediminis]|uniref:Glycosyltransferase family 10 (Fucosyltransferase) n=1 Tax=Roseovarius litorisediminis TaxID=1312363 RepID=A0A1Y5TK29_9RHOB|nr:hypothetical protein [Roseovarius litorisediminis]SLN65781.1 hypothetical protein PEL8287_03628 [Roseovarius litorisediminis]